MANKLVAIALTITADTAKYGFSFIELKHRAIIEIIVTHQDKFNSDSISIIESSEFTLFGLAK